MKKTTNCACGIIMVIFLVACDSFTDPATRLAYDIEKGSDDLKLEEGATYTIRHSVPSRSGECVGPYKVQLDKVGAIIVWCMDDAGAIVSSHSTSYHSRFIDSPKTFIIEKSAGAALVIELRRQGGRAVVTNLQ